MTRTARRPLKTSADDSAELRALLLEIGFPLTPGSTITRFGGSFGGEDFEFDFTDDDEGGKKK